MSETETIENSEQTTETTEEKQSTKTFTQSDFDKMVAKKETELKSKFKDYGTIKSKLENLEIERKEKELAEATELEKRDIKITELSDKLNSISSEYDKQKKINLRNEVVGLPKYKDLPRVYKTAIELSDERDTIVQNADSILKEWQNDKGVTEDFGKPITTNGGSKPTKTQNLAQRVKDKISSHYDYYKKE